MSTVAEKLTAIADKIRSYTANTDKLTLDSMKLGIDDVYGSGLDCGYTDGYFDGYDKGEQDGYDEGYDMGEAEGWIEGRYEGREQGKKDAYDEFWDSFQKNGTRTMYNFSFGCGWNADNFKPKYPMKPTKAYMMFYNNEDDCLIIPDFVEFCDNLAREQGKTPETHPDMFIDGHYQLLDFSECTTANSALARIHTKHHGVLDFSKCTNMSQVFYSHNWAPGRTIAKIDKFISSETTAFTANTFQYAVSLADITMSGVVAKSINFQDCPLTPASMKSVINCLKDGAGRSVTFSDSCWAALEADSVAPDGGTWKNYVLSKGWSY